MLSQYLLRIQFQQYTFCWFQTSSQHWSNIGCQYICDCLHPTKIQHCLSTLVKCWSNVGKKLLVDNYFSNVGQMLGANMLGPKTKPMLSQYLLWIQIQQYTFVGFKHHRKIDPTFSILSIICIQQKSNIVCQHWSNVGAILWTISS